MIPEQSLPDDWEVKTIEEVVNKSTLGGTPSRSNEEYWNGEIPWISSGQVRGKYTTKNPEEHITQKGLKESSTQIWPAGTVLVAMHGRGTIGRSAISSIDLAGNQSICGLTVNPEIINNEFLYYWLQNIQQLLINKGRGATASRQNLNQKLIIETKVPVPPLDKQEEIVHIIERELDSITQIRNSIQHIETLVSEYEDSMRTYLLTGHLDFSSKTVGRLPSEDQLPDGWSLKEFGEIIHSSLYGCNPTTGEDIDGIPYLRLSDFNEHSKIQGIPKYADLDPEEVDKYKLEPGDVVIGRSGNGTVGKAYVYNPSDGEMVYASYLIRFKLDTAKVSPQYIKQFVQSPIYWMQVYNTARSTAQMNLNAGEIKSFEIPVPPLDIQEEISETLNEVRQAVSNTNEYIRSMVEYINEYRNSILHFAFRGELSSDDSVEEGNGSKQYTQSTLPQGEW